ncbi:MAG: ABC transporter ATP-binding protein [Mycoplasmataceae bacterium]|jgi:ABC-2 type transport system ATP-binding protein|nr:ABC transporter ATP-binding protein [Mycoplasmataceae bacterium]
MNTKKIANKEAAVVENTTSKTLISLKNIRKEYGKNETKVMAVDGVSFNINEGENLALIGANGAGKTTTVEMILGINKPTSGTISYLFSKSGKAEDVKKELGIQFQDSTYPQYISVKKLITFIINAYNIRISTQELNSLIKTFKIKSFYNNPAASLSGGQTQRLNIFLSLIHKPKVVFLDELSTGLDITTRNDFKDFIKQYAIDNKMTIVLISHDVTEILALTDRMILLKKGKVVRDICLKDFKKDPASFQKYLEDNLN